jgi:hypothetical protein
MEDECAAEETAKPQAEYDVDSASAPFAEALISTDGF